MITEEQLKEWKAEATNCPVEEFSEGELKEQVYEDGEKIISLIEEVRRLSFTLLTMKEAAIELQVEALIQLRAKDELIAKKDRQLRLASNYAYETGALDLAKSTSEALALTEKSE